MNWMKRLDFWLSEQPRRADAASLITLLLLWAGYYWRVFTPNAVDRVRLIPGDFSGQFFSFGAYQARRMLSGEIPLWNPYNYGGHPFLADTQSAVFYPPRLLTVLISHLIGGWSYEAIQLEGLLHVLLASLLMWLFVRTITGSTLAGLASAVTYAYGGYLSGYPILQLAVLEAGCWFPLALLGVYKATNSAQWDWRWLSLSAGAFGLSLLAGHPQTSLFMMYGLAAYATHRAWITKARLLPLVIALILVIGLGFGMAAIQVLPGLEYAGQVARAAEGYEWGAGGFPLWDIASFAFPNVLSGWSPLYSGIAAILLAAFAVARREESARFWLLIAALGLLHALGGATILWDIVYRLVPGFTLFRGQERAAYVIAIAISILSGLGVKVLQSLDLDPRRARRFALIAVAGVWYLAIQAVVLELALPSELYLWVQSSFWTAVTVTLLALAFGLYPALRNLSLWPLTLILVAIFDLFSVTIGTNFEPAPAENSPLYSALVEETLEDAGLFRIDGFIGVGGNHATLVGLQDIRGVSPLQPAANARYFELPQMRRHQLYAVKYVFTDWEQLEVPSTIIATDYIPYPIHLHHIDENYPRAWMVYQLMDTPDEAQALGWIADPAFDPFRTATVAERPDLDLPESGAAENMVRISHYAPERIVIQAMTAEDGMLIVSETDYPGWYAEVDGVPTDIIRVNAGMRGVALPEGTHEVMMVYQPMSFRMGLWISMAAVVGLLALAIVPGRVLPKKGIV